MTASQHTHVTFRIYLTGINGCQAIIQACNQLLAMTNTGVSCACRLFFQSADAGVHLAGRFGLHLLEPQELTANKTCQEITCPSSYCVSRPASGNTWQQQAHSERSYMPYSKDLQCLIWVKYRFQSLNPPPLLQAVIENHTPYLYASTLDLAPVFQQICPLCGWEQSNSDYKIMICCTYSHLLLT